MNYKTLYRIFIIKILILCSFLLSFQGHCNHFSLLEKHYQKQKNPLHKKKIEIFLITLTSLMAQRTISLFDIVQKDTLYSKRNNNGLYPLNLPGNYLEQFGNIEILKITLLFFSSIYYPYSLKKRPTLSLKEHFLTFLNRPLIKEDFSPFSKQEHFFDIAKSLDPSVLLQIQKNLQKRDPLGFEIKKFSGLPFQEKFQNIILNSWVKLKKNKKLLVFMLHFSL